VNAEVNSGSIKGKVVGEAIEGDGTSGVVPLKDAQVSVYTTGDIYITETSTDENGNFIIRGLDAGDYKIEIEHNSYINYESETISVTVGEIIDVGTIELLVPVS
jgi:hypothetical protein